MRIETTRRFLRDAKYLIKKYPSFKSDLANQFDNLLEDPHQGESLGRGCYKVRIAITSKGKGKSGGARLITYVRIQHGIISLLTIYDKSDKENLGDDELDDLLNQIEY